MRILSGSFLAQPSLVLRNALYLMSFLATSVWSNSNLFNKALVVPTGIPADPLSYINRLSTVSFKNASDGTGGSSIYFAAVTNDGRYGIYNFSKTTNLDLALVLFGSALFVFANVAIDIIYGFIDPRVRVGANRGQ